MRPVSDYPRQCALVVKKSFAICTVISVTQP
jgi:hypothetical protein